MKEIFYELIHEARDGKVIIDYEEWPIGFNTIIYDNGNIKYQLLNDNNLSTLVIKDEELFFNKLEKYINLEKELGRKSVKFYRDIEKNSLKLLLAYLFVNAEVEDFKNPIEYLERIIYFLEDSTFDYLKQGIAISLGQSLLNSNLEIKNIKQSVLMETANKIEISLRSKENEIFKLPSISYGIKSINNEKECYIYSILNSKQEDNKFSKKINRILYKLNKGVLDEETSEYLEFKEGNSNYYPENISDVSPSAVLSLTIFINLLKKVGIKKIKVVPYLPLRYLSRNLVASEKAETIKENLIKRNDAIQSNITDKLIRTIRRVSYHIKDLEIVSFPYELSEFLELNLGENKINSNNELLSDVTDNIDKKI